MEWSGGALHMRERRRVWGQEGPPRVFYFGQPDGGANH